MKLKNVLMYLIWSLVVPALLFVGCEKNDPGGIFQPQEKISTKPNRPNFIKLNSAALQRTIEVSQWVTQANGGFLHLYHGDPNGVTANMVYGNISNDSLSIFRIDPFNPTAPELVGQLAFPSNAIALHPVTGKVYYVALQADDSGLYRVGVWDPVTNTNTILPGGSPFAPAAKLAFRSDGTLFGVKRNATNELYTIDVNTGDWTLYAVLSEELGTGGDMAFDRFGWLFSTGGNYPHLKVTDLNNGQVYVLNQIGAYQVRGLAFGKFGYLFFSTMDARMGIMNPYTGEAMILGPTGLPTINDMSPVLSSTELMYAEATLQVFPGTISEDAEITISMETTELVGGVHLTFEPHGITFSQPAILNMAVLGADLSGVDPSTIDIYYENQDTGIWEPMPRDTVIVDVNAGLIAVINGRLPHFSRYGIAAD
ncbi:MAG: hypothetical protein D6748_07755 [Calditrichaeota bacterium]|nr:MAG: hypothetical protein D6748_07755 [Calditrichota bacterium]